VCFIGGVDEKTPGEGVFFLLPGWGCLGEPAATLPLGSHCAVEGRGEDEEVIAASVTDCHTRRANLLWR